MEYKRIYTIISVILGVLYLYATFNLVMSFVNIRSFVMQSLLYILPVAAGLTGVLLFVTSQFKKSSLLRLCMCYELFSFPFTLIFYIGFFSRKGEYGISASSINWTFYLGVVIDLLYLLCSAVGLWYLSKKRVPKISYYGEGENKTGQFEPANAWLRFANRLIDVLLIFFIVIKSIYSLRYWVSKSWLPESEGLLYVAEMLFLLFYYLLFEGVFNTTAGKCATNTTIVNNSGGRPNFGQILGRTFCRFIPFDSFSFFKAGARGWHDSIPDTYVIETVDMEDAGMNEITLDLEQSIQ